MASLRVCVGRLQSLSGALPCLAPSSTRHISPSLVPTNVHVCYFSRTSSSLSVSVLTSCVPSSCMLSPSVLRGVCRVVQISPSPHSCASSPPSRRLSTAPCIYTRTGDSGLSLASGLWSLVSGLWSLSMSIVSLVCDLRRLTHSLTHPGTHAHSFSVCLSLVSLSLVSLSLSTVLQTFALCSLLWTPGVVSRCQFPVHW
jgi:hypothetical protein